MDNVVVKGPWVKAAKHNVSPKTQAAREKAHAEDICERITQISIDAERELGLRTLRQMLIATLHWVDMRLQYKQGGKP